MKINVSDFFANKKELNPEEIVKKLIDLRNIKNIQEFLNPPEPNKFNLKDFGFNNETIDVLFRLLKECFEKNKKIVVYTDYDADGITGGAILWETLYLLGFDTVPYVPSRKLEGYGFSELGINNVKEKYDPGLIISVDHGIAAISQIEYAKKLGIPVIVTDHHHRQEKIPDKAEAIFHIPSLSGSATAYYVAKEIFEYFKKQNSFNTRSKMNNLITLDENFKNDYVALSSIGTVADLVPLTFKSRHIVFHGLKKFISSARPGIRNLLSDSKIQKNTVSTYDIGFLIAPRINAVGRLDDALDALRLLCTKNNKKASHLSKRVGDLNTKRQQIVKQSVDEAIKKIETQNSIPKIIVIDDDTWHEGIIGLIASKILEKYYRPTVVMTKSEKFYKASVRSISGLHITNFLSEFKDLLAGFGGHAAAAGFTLPVENKKIFMQKVFDYAEKVVTDNLLEKVLNADLEIPINLVSMKLHDEMVKMEPFGIGNPRPVFLSKVLAKDVMYMGQQKNHLKIKAIDVVKNTKTVDMVFFNGQEKIQSINLSDPFNVLYSIDKNEWNGRVTVQATVQHVLPLEVEIKRSII